MKMRVWNKALWSDEVTPLEKENLRVAYQAAVEGIVLLENDGCLPLQKGKVALFGAGAGMTIKGGTGSGEVNERHAVSIYEGMENAGFTVTTKKWIENYEELYKKSEEQYGKDFRKRVVTSAFSNIMEIMDNPFQHPYGDLITEEELKESDTDTCVYVIARQAGEGGDRKLDRQEYSLSVIERENLKLCAKMYEKMIVVINVGCSFDMNFLDEIPGINAAVFFCQQGSRGGEAFADLMLGNAVPSGKLADTWAKNYEDFPNAMEYSYLNGELNEEYYKEGIYVGYRYFDSFQVEPRYAFGYGLSYTDFEITAGQVFLQGAKVHVNAAVKNTGDRFGGKEVVQLYVSCPNGKLTKEYQKLAAFEKTDLIAPGMSEEVELSFEMRDLASYDETSGEMILEKGDYVLRLGNSSRNTAVCGVVRLQADTTVSKHEHICQREEWMEEISAPVSEAFEVDADVSVLELDVKEVQIETYEYGKPAVYSSEEVDALMDELTMKELAALTVGNGMGTGSYFHAPGTVGTTTSKTLEKGIPNICMADGPAGLRLQKRAVVLKNGKVKAVDPFISLMNYIPEIGKKMILGDPEKHPVIYQFTTAFPVGLSLAQTWNKTLLEEIGSAVGREMEAYGITYWLAPALNIHRNPLCGRNFEYFSEDPLLSGKVTAQLTKGVQKHRGCFVTLKHFCCNNQEDNRNKTNANLNERALREIYLKGFEIAVRESNPGAVMTSYNKVNGVYANNSEDLLIKALRNEWGFDGLVMTDWYATGKGLGNPAIAVGSGNDLIMPGGPGAEKEIMAAVEHGLIEAEDVKRSAANVVRGIVSSRIYQAYKKQNKK